jgi:Transposase, Mutator family
VLRPALAADDPNDVTASPFADNEPTAAPLLRQELEHLYMPRSPPKDCCKSGSVLSERRRRPLKSCQTMKEAYAVRRTVQPSAEIQASIDKLLARGMVDDPQKMLSSSRGSARGLIIQRAVEEEFDAWLARARYERRPAAGPGKRNGFRPRHLQTGKGELQIEIPQVREAAMPFVSKLFPKWHCKRLLRTDPLKALVIGGFVRDLSMREATEDWVELGRDLTGRGLAAPCLMVDDGAPPG